MNIKSSFFNKMLEPLYLQNHLLMLINCVLFIASVERKNNAQSEETSIQIHYGEITVPFREDSVFEWR